MFLAGALDGPAPNAVVLRRGDAWVVDARHPLASVPEVRAAFWGDLDDDGLVDVVLCRPGGRHRDLAADRGGPVGRSGGARARRLAARRRRR